jgi:hypothetical protein
MVIRSADERQTDGDFDRNQERINDIQQRAQDALKLTFIMRVIRFVGFKVEEPQIRPTKWLEE